MLVTQTDLYAEQKRGAEENSVWYPVSVKEMKVVNKPNIKSYWSTDPILCTPFFPAIMSRTRFVPILRYLHFDLTHQTTTNYTKFNLFLILFITLRVNLLLMRLIKFKGRVHFRQFIPSIPGRFGIKAFTLAESTSGYVLGGRVYTGKEAGVVQKIWGKELSCL